MGKTKPDTIKKKRQSKATGFAKGTDFRWLSLSLVIFFFIAVFIPTPQSMIDKAGSIYASMDISEQAVISTEEIAYRIQVTIGLLAMCVVFFATEAVPLPAVALIIGLVQLFFGLTPPSGIVATYAHDAVWFIAGSLAIGVTLVKFGLDKRIGMLVVNLAGTKTRMIVLGILLGTAIPSAFINEASIAPMYIPIALALFTLTSKTVPAPRLGKLLMISIAVGCMVGAPMSPTGGARNAIMIGFLSNMGVDVSFMQWMSMGVFYTVVMSVIMAFVLPLLYKPEVADLSDAVSILKKDLERYGKMTGKQWLVTGIMLFAIFLWITDKTLTKSILGFPLGLGGVAVTIVVIYMLFGLTTWKDYEEGVSWGVVVLYAGAISLGSVFKDSGAAGWLADSIMKIVEPLGMNSGVPLVILVVVVGACLTNLMSAGATVAVIGPVILGMADSSGTNPLIIGIVLAISTSAAFWLVIGTPASSIVYASGQVEAKDFIRLATIAWPIALLAIIGMVIIYWLPVLGIPISI